MRLKYIWLLLLPALFTQVSCQKWLDVKPKVQLDAETLFSNERGYKDVLTGVYIKISGTNMYGRETTFGLLDVIGQVYPNIGSPASAYGAAKVFNYPDAKAGMLINSIWVTGYTAIANLNELIEHLRNADKTIFARDNYNVILGEALGLRAMIHFDLLRLFGPSYKSNPSAPGIPYVNKSGHAVTPFSTVAEALDLVAADLTEAAALMKASDPIITNRVITTLDDNGYLLQRNYHFNYYAASALLARVYLYKADYANAIKYADEVINSGKFKWIAPGIISTASEAQRDRTFTAEQVFAFRVPRLLDFINGVLDVTVQPPPALALYHTTTSINQLYPETSDWRKLYLWSAELTPGGPRYCTKLAQPTGIIDSLAQRVSIIRLPELYLISAEAALATDQAKAISRLRELRVHRGLPEGIPDGTPEATLRSEILKEYKREFVTEGILFFQYKRLDASTMDGLTGSFDKSKYVLPIPTEGELEYRQ